MSAFRDEIEAGYDDLFDEAGESIQVVRGNEKLRIEAIVEEPTRGIEGDAGIEFDTPRMPFVVLRDKYRFGGVAVEPERTDRIVYRGRTYQPWGEGTQSHVERSDPFGKAWRIFTIDQGGKETC